MNFGSMVDVKEDDIKTEIEPLEILALFGFDGKIQSGLKVHPDGVHLIFPLGSKVVITNTNSNVQRFLCGHTNTVSTIDVSKSGRLIASGQINHMGFRAYVIIWSWETKKEVSRHELHKVRVEALCFTSNEMYLVSLGGKDDGTVVVWNLEKKAAVCGAQATKEVTGDANRLCALHHHGSLFLTAGEQNLRIWTIDQNLSKLHVQDVCVGKLRREYTNMRVNHRDDIMYAGTMSGDIVKVQLNCQEVPNAMAGERPPILIGCFARHNPKKPPGKDCEKYKNGVRDLLIINETNQLVIGAGDGTIELVEERNAKFNKEYPTAPTWPQLKTLKRRCVNGSVSSLQKKLDSILIGTDACEIYVLNLVTFDLKLIVTCNTSAVYDIAFPHNFSLVFATASHQSVRIWSSAKRQELLRIMVPNFAAAAVVFSYDGKSIISAWNDGIIRAFTPLKGQLQYAILNAHNKGCSCLTISSCGKTLVSGGCEGQVRIWKLEANHQSLVGVLKDHTAPVCSVEFNKFDKEVVSSSSDGTCIIWDIARLTRKKILYANTQFSCARYFPSGVQILATGSDRHISYWEVYDASLVRDVEGSTKGAVNCLSLNSTGETFASAGADQTVRLWDYQAGEPICIGHGHAASIISCKYSPCGKFVVTGSADGAVIMWNVPKKYWPKEQYDPLDVSSVMKKSSKRDLSLPSHDAKRPEHIKQLETSRSNKEVHISECPAVNSNRNSSVSSKKSSSSTLISNKSRT